MEALMSDSEPSLDELRANTEKSNRIETEREKKEENTLTNAIINSFEEIDEGRSKTLSLRDENIAALVYGLETHSDNLQAVGKTLRNELDRDDSGTVDRSELLRLAIRVGLQQAAPDVIEAAGDAKAQYASNQF